MARSNDTLLTIPEITATLAKQRAVQTKVRQLLTEGVQLQTTQKQAEERLKEIKADLAAIQLQYDLTGLRAGKMCCTTVEREGRLTLSKEALVDSGVDPEVIASSMKRGASYLESRIEVIG